MALFSTVQGKYLRVFTDGIVHYSSRLVFQGFHSCVSMITYYYYYVQQIRDKGPIALGGGRGLVRPAHTSLHKLLWI